MTLRPALLAAALALPLAACEPEATLDPYQQQVLAERFARDQDFRKAPSSLLAPDVRARFQALRYYDVDPAWRFRLKMRSAPLDTVRVPMHQGGTEPYVRVGYVDVPVPGSRPHALAVFRPATGDPVLWVPFTDFTSGKDTYGGGRYLYPKALPGDSLEVDFNRAQNPNCDYNPDAFNCALAPPENRLPVEVTVGEKRSLLVGA